MHFATGMHPVFLDKSNVHLDSSEVESQRVVTCVRVFQRAYSPLCLLKSRKTNFCISSVNSDILKKLIILKSMLYKNDFTGSYNKLFPISVFGLTSKIEQFDLVN